MFVDFLAFALANGLTSPPVTRADLIPGLNTSPPERVELFVQPQEWARTCKPWDDWDKPAPPFKISTNVYYVGTCGITVLLVQTESGLVLIDTGTEGGAQVAYFNIMRLGFSPDQIKAILYSHEHFDHVGGMAFFQEKTGAPVLSAPGAVNVFLTGKDHPDDPQEGIHEPMAKVPNVIPIMPGTALHFGGTSFVPITTPGHTVGALSWQWESCDGDACKTIVYADSLSPVSKDGYKFSDHPEYLANYRAGLDRLAALDCDILLTPHPSHSKMVKRAESGTFEGGVTCADYATGKHRDLNARLAKEAASE